MNLIRKASELIRLHRRTLRLQLALLYAGAFVALGAILLGISGLLVRSGSTSISGSSSSQNALIGPHFNVGPALVFAGTVLVAVAPGWLIAGRVVLNPRLTVRDLVFGSYFYFGLMLAAALGLAYRRSLLTALDRRFFREAFNQEQLLRQLIEDIKGRDSIRDISRLVCDKLEEALHPVRVFVFYRRERREDVLRLPLNCRDDHRPQRLRPPPHAQ